MTTYYTYQGQKVKQIGWDQPMVNYAQNYWASLPHGTKLDCGSIVRDLDIWTIS